MIGNPKSLSKRCVGFLGGLLVSWSEYLVTELKWNRKSEGKIRILCKFAKFEYSWKFKSFAWKADKIKNHGKDLSNSSYETVISMKEPLALYVTDNWLSQRL